MLMKMKTVLVLVLLWTVDEAAAQQTVRRGELVVLPCPVKVEARNFAVSWSKDSGTRKKNDLKLSEQYGRIRLAEDKVSLMISSAMVADAGLYNCRVILPQQVEMTESIQLIIQAPPSAPQLFLQVPSNPVLGQWHLMCVTKGFYPAQLSLRWTWRSTAAGGTPTSVSCTLKLGNQGSSKVQTHAENTETSSFHTNSSVNLHPHTCLSGPDGPGPETQLTSMLSLPSRKSVSTDIKFTCTVEDHPASETILSASYDWEAASNEVMGCLNIIKLVILTGICVLFITMEIVLLCERRTKYSEIKG